MKKEERFFVQVIKYGLVGVLNTLLTATVIWCILFLFSNKNNSSPSALLMSVANIAGYTVGVANSFILNRNWTFKSKTSWETALMRFLAAFTICYVIQLGIVLWLNALDVSFGWQINIGTHKLVITWAYVCQLIGIVVYSVLNFLLNKYYAFNVNKNTIIKPVNENT